MKGRRKSTLFRELLEQPGIVVIPCAYDCLSLRIVERAGFKAAMHGGYNVSASFLGIPDVGLMTMTEMMTYARNMAAAVDIPVICDVDDGFGDVINVTRTTREVIRSDLAGLYIEDQVAPKRCAALGGSDIIPAPAMVRKLKAVTRVREEEDPDFVVIARTHSSRTHGMAEAVERGLAYAEAGADIIFVDPGYSDEALDEFRIMAEQIGPHAHVIANMTETVDRPLLTSEELHAMGFKIAIYPLTALMAAAGAVELIMRELHDKGTTRGLVDRLMPLGELSKLTGIEAVWDLEKELHA